MVTNQLTNWKGNCKLPLHETLIIPVFIFRGSMAFTQWIKVRTSTSTSYGVKNANENFSQCVGCKQNQWLWQQLKKSCTGNPDCQLIDQWYLTNTQPTVHWYIANKVPMLSQLHVGQSVDQLSTNTQPKVNTTRPSLDWHLTNTATDMWCWLKRYKLIHQSTPL